jgi:hypothetical protein
MLVATYPKEKKREENEWAAMKFDFFRERI